jgi:DNA-nicking Smr family endonuclease
VIVRSEYLAEPSGASTRDQASGTGYEGVEVLARERRCAAVVVVIFTPTTPNTAGTATRQRNAGEDQTDPVAADEEQPQRDRHPATRPSRPLRVSRRNTGNRASATSTLRLRTMGGVKLKLDLHDIYNRGEEIDRALRAIMDEAVAKKAPLVEIIPGKGSGQLKKRVLRFLDQKEIRALYHRVEKDRDNFGRIFVHFRWK